jgi:signal transduction histidine kinase
VTTTSSEARPAGLGARLAANPVAVDAFIALGLTALSILAIIGGAQDLGSYDPLSLVLLMLTTLPLLVRRRWPLAVFIVCFGATMGHAALAREQLSTTLGFLVALFTVGERRDRRTSGIVALVAAVIVAIIIAWRASLPAGLSGLVQTELAILATWVLGTWSRDRGRRLGTAEERAARLESEREARDRQAVAEERERIARELHDVVTHHVSVIVIQAGAAERALDKRPADARTAIEAIDHTARQALTDMRRMLGILGRASADGGAAGPAGGGSDRLDELAPMPGLDRLGDLLERVRAAGTPVELSVTGERRPLDPGIELSAYRIIQEALTNALRHAPGARARVSVGYSPAALDIEVDDDGFVGRRLPATSEPGSGHGLIGMRERVAVFGGEFEAYATEHGFRVHARLPLRGTAT